MLQIEAPPRNHVNETAVPSVSQFSQEQLQPGLLEEAEIASEGFSFRAALKDITRVFSTRLEDLDLPEQEQTWVTRNWEHLSDDFQQGKQLPPRVDAIVGDVHSLLYAYLEDNISKHLGEVVVTDKAFCEENPDLKQALEASPTLNHWVQNHQVRKRIFKYDMSMDWIKLLLRSTELRSEIGGGERELIEQQNMRIISKLANLAEQDQESERSIKERSPMMVEISPPVYEFQTEMMVRFHSLGKNGWQTTQLSLPNEYEPLSLQSGVEEALRVHGISHKILPKRFGDIEAGNELLAQPFLIIDSDIKSEEVQDIFLEACTNLRPDAPINRRLLQENDLLIDEHLGKIMDEVPPLINNIIRDTVAIHSDESRMQANVRAYDQTIHGAKATVMSQSDLNEQNYTAQDIQNIRDVKRVVGAASSGQLGGYVASNISTRGLSVSTSGDCVTTERTYSPVGIGAEAIFNQSKLPEPIKVGDKQIEWVRLTGNDGKTRTVLASCPICGHKHLDPCATFCQGCKLKVSDIYQAYKKGTLDNMKKSGINSATPSMGILGVILNLLFPFMDLPQEARGWGEAEG